MKRWTGPIAAALFAMAIARAAAPGSVPAMQSDVRSRLAQIRQKLSSDDFHQREDGQKDLDAIPAFQVGFLRTAVKQEVDPEVRLRLELRIEAMEIYNLEHPPTLTLKLKNATLKDAADQLNHALGGTYIQATENTGSITLDLKEASFGEVLEQISRQQRVSVSQIQSANADGASTTLRLTPSSAPSLPAFVPSGSFALLPIFLPNSRGETAMLRVLIVCDPRIRGMQNSSVPTLQTITDQDGKDIVSKVVPTPTAGVSPRPSSLLSTGFVLSQVAGITRIHEFRGTVNFSAIQKEKKLAIDLNHLPQEPIDTPRGPLVIEKSGGIISLKIGENPALARGPQGAPVRLQPITITARASQGDKSTVTTTINRSFNLTALIQPLGDNPMVEISWIDATREFTIPIDFKDIPLLAPTAVSPVNDARPNQ